jgi:branched-chain amino acid transport system substrate-binding protein
MENAGLRGRSYARAAISAWITGILLLCLVARALSVAAADTYDIYAILPLTGSNAFNGREERDGLSVLQTSVNRGGGINGRSINFIVLDSQSSPQVAVEMTNQVVAKHVPLIIGETSTGTCAAMAPLLTKGPVQFCLSPGFRPTPGGYSYSLAPTPEAEAAAVMHYFRLRGWNRVALLLGTDATGQLIAGTYTAAAALPENKAISVVALERFNPSDISVAAQLARIRAAKAQVLVAFVTGTPFDMVMRSLRDSGISLPVLTSQGNLNYATLAAAGDAVPKILLFCNGPVPAAGEPVPDGPHKAAQLSYLAAFRAAGIKPEYGDAAVWDTGAIVTAALRAVGLNATPDQIRTYVNGLHDYPGVEGMFDFRDGKMRGLTELRVMAWDRTRSTWDILPDQLDH